ncbi:MAG: YceI family protein, partial [Sphingobacteriales bacterium]|nr:YceI family protein [Sphingobacteriales bacterium]
MKKVLFALLIVLSGTIAVAQYKPADQGSVIQFTVQNLGFDVTGTFSGLLGNIVFDTKHPATSIFDISIDANSVNTDNTLR